MDFDARRTDAEPVLPVEKLCDVATFSCLLEPFSHPHPRPFSSIQYRRLSVRISCQGLYKKPLLCSVMALPLHLFSALLFPEQGSTHGSCSIFGGQWLLTFSELPCTLVSQTRLPRICTFPGSSPEF